MQKLHRNIPLLFIIKAAKWFMLYMPLIYLFYIENGFDVAELFALHAIYSLIIAFLEVPSGYIADVWGRKPAIVFGTLFGVVGFGAYSLGYSLTGFIIAEVFLGIGQSLLSGADSAMLYDTLLQEKKEKKYLSLEGKITATGNIAEALAGLFVFVVVFETVRANFYLQTAFALVAFMAALFLLEPEAHKVQRKNSLADIWDIIVHTLHRNKELRNIVFFSAVIGFASLTMAWFAQPVFHAIGLEKAFYGLAWVFLNTLVAIGSLFSSRLEKYMSYKTILLVIAVPLSVSFVLLALKLSFIVFVPLIVFYLVRGIAHPVLKDFINRLTTSDKRATVLSARSLLIRILYSAIGPMLGYFSDRFSLQLALILCGVTIFITSFVFLAMIFISRKQSVPVNRST